MPKQKRSSFFSYLFRMRYIHRWGLMRNTMPENLEEHSMEVAAIAHILATIANARFGGRLDAGKIAVSALFHDAPEIFTGDLPTPVKYHNPEIRAAYRKVETIAQKKLISLLPEDLAPFYETIFVQDEEEEILVKAADRFAALIKCICEKNAGNKEFEKAYEAQLAALSLLCHPAVRCFQEEFLPGFLLTLDEQETQDGGTVPGRSLGNGRPDIEVID